MNEPMQCRGQDGEDGSDGTNGTNGKDAVLPANLVVDVELYDNDGGCRLRITFVNPSSVKDIPLGAAACPII